MAIFQTFLIYFKFLRFSGSFPYTFPNSKDPKSLNPIRFVLLSKPVVWFSVIFGIKVCVIYFSNIDRLALADDSKFDNLPIKNTTYEMFVVTAMKRSMDLHFIVHTLFSIVGIKSTEKIFILWEEFNQKFQKVVGVPRDREVLKGHCCVLAIFILTIFPALCLIMGVAMLYHQTYGDAMYLNLQSLGFIFIVFMANFNPHLDDFKCILYIYCIQLCFKEVKQDIKNRIQTNNLALTINAEIALKSKIVKSLELFHPRDSSHTLIHYWHELIVILNEVTKQTGDNLGYLQIFSISHELFIVTVSTYSMLQLLPLPEDPDDGALPFFYFGILASGFYGLRTFIKCYVSQAIENEEMDIVRQLEKIDTCQLSPEAKFEVRYFIECVQKTPSLVCLSGYFSLDLSFFLKMVGTLVTYLVVLVQFKDIFAAK